MVENLRSSDGNNPMVISVSGLSKSYRIWESPAKRLRAWLMEGAFHLASRFLRDDSKIARYLGRQLYIGFREIHALRQVSLQIGRGEVVGIIGYNGSGKSTLLQILAGTLTPSSGRVEVNGRVAALLELGSGINPEFTGRENIFLSGAILGFPRSVLEKRMHAIEEFAELGEFIDEPVKTYSTGMAARLAFSVLTQLDPDIFIVDETLSVGDAYFQHKSINLIRRFQEAGKTMLIVSHSPETIKSMCTRAVLLERGHVIREGAAADICDYYNALVAKKRQDQEIHQVEREKGRIVTRSGDRKVAIGDVELLDQKQIPARAFTVGEEARVACALEFRAAIDNPTVGILIRDRLGSNVFGSNTFNHQRVTGNFAAGSRCEITFVLRLNLAPGRYSVSVAAHSGRDHLSDNYDWQDNVVVFEVIPGKEPRFIGTAWLPLVIQVDRESVALLRPYAWGRRLDFGIDGDAVRHKHAGWAIPEEISTWTDGPEAILRFDLPASQSNRVFRMRAAGFCTANIHHQRVNVFLDEHQVGTWEVSQTAEHSVILPSKRLTSADRHRIRLVLPDASSPQAEGLSTDSRLLGLQVFSACIE
jgi:lipopolysaccharide transport system ATP-binding protein